MFEAERARIYVRTPQARPRFNWRHLRIAQVNLPWLLALANIPQVNLHRSTGLCNYCLLTFDKSTCTGPLAFAIIVC